MKWPLFISFEGIDKSGKGTQASAIKKWLEEETGRKVALLSEPHDKTPIGKHIRRILRKEIPPPSTALEMQRLFTLDRAQGWYCFIKPLLDRKISCVLERYAHSTVAYGAAADMGLSPSTLLKMQYEIVGPDFQWPDLTIFLEITPEAAILRLSKGDKKTVPQLFETRERLARVRVVYYDFFAWRAIVNIGHVVTVNGERSPKEVTEDIKQILAEKFEL